MFFVNSKAHCAVINDHVIAPSSTSPTASGNYPYVEKSKLDARERNFLRTS